jgi:hypothetical protein
MTDEMTLRELINELERLSEAGKNDNLEIGVESSDDTFFIPIKQIVVGEYYSEHENPIKCIMIKY